MDRTTVSIVEEFGEFLIEPIEEVCRDVHIVEVVSNFRLQT